MGMRWEGDRSWHLEIGVKRIVTQKQGQVVSPRDGIALMWVGPQGVTSGQHGGMLATLRSSQALKGSRHYFKSLLFHFCTMKSLCLLYVLNLKQLLAVIFYSVICWFLFSQLAGFIFTTICMYFSHTPFCPLK